MKFRRIAMALSLAITAMSASAEPVIVNNLSDIYWLDYGIDFRFEGEAVVVCNGGSFIGLQQGDLDFAIDSDGSIPAEVEYGNVIVSFDGYKPESAGVVNSFMLPNTIIKSEGKGEVRINSSTPATTFVECCNRLMRFENVTVVKSDPGEPFSTKLVLENGSEAYKIMKFPVETGVYSEVVVFVRWYDAPPFSLVCILSVGDKISDAGVDALDALQTPSDALYYNLQGIKVDKPSHGIFVSNGKKIILK